MKSCPTTVPACASEIAAARERAAGARPAHPLGFVHQHEEVTMHERNRGDEQSRDAGWI